MTRIYTKGCIRIANQESARDMTRDGLTQKPEISTMGAMLRTDARRIYK